jgi:hypothetical protein
VQSVVCGRWLRRHGRVAQAVTVVALQWHAVQVGWGVHALLAVSLAAQGRLSTCCTQAPKPWLLTVVVWVVLF